MCDHVSLRSGLSCARARALVEVLSTTVPDCSHSFGSLDLVDGNSRPCFLNFQIFVRLSIFAVFEPLNHLQLIPDPDPDPNHDPDLDPDPDLDLDPVGAGRSLRNADRSLGKCLFHL